jgi:hypothetical protein
MKPTKPPSHPPNTGKRISIAHALAVIKTTQNEKTIQINRIRLGNRFTWITFFNWGWS